jgi:hypothetical protein
MMQVAVSSIAEGDSPTEGFLWSNGLKRWMYAGK